MSNPIQGYIRLDAPLKVLETAVQTSSTDPLAGFLEIATAEGVLRLAINGDALKTCASIWINSWPKGGWCKAEEGRRCCSRYLEFWLPSLLEQFASA